LQRTVSGRFHSSIDFLNGCCFFGFDNQVDQRDVRGRYANSQTVKLTLQFRQDQGDSLGSSGGRRNHRQGGGTGTAHVAMWQVEDALIVCVGVNRSHQTFDDAEVFQEHLGNWCQTVGGAGCIRNNIVPGGIVKFFIDAHTDCQIDLFARSADDNLAGAGLDMLASIFAVSKEACRFDNDVNAKLFPGQGSRVTFAENLDQLAVNLKTVLSGRDISREDTVNRVVFEQVCESLWAGEIVDGNNFEL